MMLNKNLHWFLYPIFFLACARQTAPTGGPKDTIPPVLQYSTPKKGQTNFKSKEIELTMSEMIILNNPKEQILITPDIEKKFEIKTKKDKVTLTLDTALADSTTYLINFREAIQDITEKNPAVNLKLAFSTGTYIDSMSITGTARELLQNKEYKDATIALYQSDTFDIFEHKPQFITKSDEKGIFEFEYLKPGNYFIYAIDDKNRNLKADSRSEFYGFISTPINLSSNAKNINIALVKLDMRPLKLTSARPYNTYFNIKTSKGLADYRITTEQKDSVISSYGEDRSIIKIYNTFPDRDSTAVRLLALDSIKNMIDTTFYVKFNTRQNTPEKFDAKLENIRVTENTGSLEAAFKFTKPLLQINYDSIYYQIDSLTRVNFNKDDFKWDTQNNITYLQKYIDKKTLAGNPEPENKQPGAVTTGQAKQFQHQFTAGKGAFIGIELDTSAQIQQGAKPVKLEDTGIIIFNVETTKPHYIIQLLDKSFKILAQRKNVSRPTFNDLMPGDYQVRVIVDTNNDGKWNPGNFFTGEEPENIIYYKNEKKSSSINLKANWELGPLLIKF